MDANPWLAPAATAKPAVGDVEQAPLVSGGAFGAPAAAAPPPTRGAGLFGRFASSSQDAPAAPPPQQAQQPPQYGGGGGGGSLSEREEALRAREADLERRLADVQRREQARGRGPRPGPSGASAAPGRQTDWRRPPPRAPRPLPGPPQEDKLSYNWPGVCGIKVTRHHIRDECAPRDVAVQACISSRSSPHPRHPAGQRACAHNRVHSRLTPRLLSPSHSIPLENRALIRMSYVCFLLLTLACFFNIIAGASILFGAGFHPLYMLLAIIWFIIVPSSALFTWHKTARSLGERARDESLERKATVVPTLARADAPAPRSCTT